MATKTSQRSATVSGAATRRPAGGWHWGACRNLVNRSLALPYAFWQECGNRYSWCRGGSEVKRTIYFHAALE
jgi:hypothetical protein